MVSIIAIPPVFIILSSMLLGSMFDARFPSRWWLLRLGLVPLISLALACYLIAAPTPIPDNFDPLTHENTGRMDWLAIMAWGVVLPTIYIAAALPMCVGYALWKRRDKAPTE